MNSWQAALARMLEALDLGFTALANLLRVLIRGRFTPDGRSFRGAGYAEILPKEVLLQEVVLNVEDAAEGRRAIALEPERYLPLTPEKAAFDLAGPIEKGETESDRSKQFLLGVTRRDILGDVRRDAVPGFLAPIEAFAFHPPDYPNLVLVFHDEKGDRVRRARRCLQLVATLALVWAAFEALTTWQDALFRAQDGAQTDEANIERRIHIAEHQLVQAKSTLGAVQGVGDPTLGSALDQLSVVARRLPQDAELTSVNWSPAHVMLDGRAFTPAAAELELRRGFQESSVAFDATAGAAPAVFKADIALSHAPRPPGPQPVSASVKSTAP